MKICSLVDNYNFNDIKAKVKTDINNKKNKDEKNKSKNKKFKTLLTEIIEIDFEFVCVAIEIKNIQYKYFEKNSEFNILKWVDCREITNKNEVEDGIDMSFLMELGIKLEDLDILDSYDNVSEPSECIKVLANLELFIADYNLLMNNIDYLLKKNKFNVEDVNIENELKLKKRYMENTNKVFAFEKEIKNTVSNIRKIKNIGIHTDEKMLIKMDVEKFKRNYSVDLCRTFEEIEEFQIYILNEMKYIFEKYCKIFDIVFIDSTESLKYRYLSLDIKKIKSKEFKIKELISKMSKKEIILFTKLTSLKFSLEKCENQMITWI